MEGALSRMRTLPWRGMFALFGGFLITLSLGSFYSFGNMMTYLTSYMRHHGSPNLTYGDFIIVQSVWGMTQGFGMPLAGYLIHWIGPRPAIATGCLIFSCGTALTYFTLNTSLPWVAVTYGFVGSFGQCIALIPTMHLGMAWFPKNKGLAMGVVVGGFGGGAFIFNQIQTAYLNPNNISTDGEYFEDDQLLERVPSLLLLLASIYLCLELIGWVLMTEPVTAKREQVSKKDDKEDNASVQEIMADEEEFVRPKEALMRREFYMLWVSRFCANMITLSVAGFYKAFGQSFISDDHFLSLVGAVSSIFNCSGRLFYGIFMDRTSYRTAILVEMVILTTLVSTLSLTSGLGKIGFALWIWAIYGTFPGTYSTQPAVTTQTFGHKYGGTIYGFLFTSDMCSAALVGVLSKFLLSSGNWTAYFLPLAGFGAVALLVTFFFPRDPGPRQQALPASDGESPAASPIKSPTTCSIKSPTISNKKLEPV